MVRVFVIVSSGEQIKNLHMKKISVGIWSMGELEWLHGFLENWVITLPPLNHSYSQEEAEFLIEALGICAQAFISLLSFGSNSSAHTSASRRRVKT